jgi:hypothetical protein
MCENTRKDLDQVIRQIDLNNLSSSELNEALALLEDCARFINHHGRGILDLAETQGRGNSTERIIRYLLGNNAI